MESDVQKFIEEEENAHTNCTCSTHDPVTIGSYLIQSYATPLMLYLLVKVPDNEGSHVASLR